MGIRKLGTISILVLLCMPASCAEPRFGGMTVREAFPDERLARLVEAVDRGDYAEADKQLKAGADVNMAGTDGVSALIWVMAGRNIKGTEYLLKIGADPNYRDKKDQFSAMYVAAGGDSPKFLELLLKYKGDPNLTGPDREPLLHTAVGQFREKNIEILLKNGADVNGRGPTDSTAAEKAAHLGRFDLVAYFLERGLTYNLQDLAESVELRDVPVGSKSQRWKEKVIDMLKQRGVKFPAFAPRDSKDVRSDKEKKK